MPPDTRLPPLSALRAFEATVRHGSVSRAARELHLTDGAVSRAVRELESDLGFDLFQRSSRAVLPTPTAQVLAQDVAGALDRLRAALARARRSAGPGRPLVLSCEPTLLIRWLIPRLAQLQAAVGGERELRLVSAGGVVHFERDGIDLAIRRNDFALADDVLAEPFVNEHIGPVCRADVAATLGRQQGAPLQGVLLHTATRPGAWDTWAALAGTPLQPTRAIRFEHFYQSLQAAVAGAGVAIGPLALVADDLASGVLCAPRGFVADGSCYQLMAPRAAEDGDGVFHTVLAWLRSACEGLLPPPQPPAVGKRQQSLQRGPGSA
ncbi:LysR family transcriptional regulator [Acidovorax sp. FJL06]|uniref:LysR family transcriptional regulator n=1 Tax=Acidovorax sp. FJL06 TaxID=2153365 RepID=UPI000F568CF2|nr:LysR family transcriptional regulator [Acidovorax sp. FJL06]RQO82451.1 LysR family transcriptional regulator [Acidovorax sp. FJL06]